ncbi:MAG: aldolase/citrate lyase family protein, partial [Pseudomonadota bacterium]
SEIARARPRIQALTMGPGDLAWALGVGKSAGDKDADPLWQYHRTQIAVTARANGLYAIDGPYFPLDNPTGLRMSASHARDCGMHGKWAIHPSQITPIQEVFSPSASDVARAQAIIAAFEKDTAQGIGAIAHEGQMIDEALIKICRETLARAHAPSPSSSQ